MNSPNEQLAAAQTMYGNGQIGPAIAAVDRLLAGDGYVPGTYLLRSRCFATGSDQETLLLALHAAEAEKAITPGLAGVDEQLAAVAARLPPSPGPAAPAARPWTAGVDANTVRHLELCSQRYTYRSVPMVKNVFDLALYPLLLWEAKPRTIIEVGSYYGGSAMWMADLMAGFGLDTRVLSVDILKVWASRHDRVTFINGSGRDLGAVLSEERLASLPRPWLVIEDADHSFETTTAVLGFFHDRLRPGEHVIVEDTMTSPPALAGLRQFLAEHPSEYDVDAKYCDYFGSNVTWCVNGFLKRR